MDMHEVIHGPNYMEICLLSPEKTLNIIRGKLYKRHKNTDTITFELTHYNFINYTLSIKGCMIIYMVTQQIQFPFNI